MSPVSRYLTRMVLFLVAVGMVGAVLAPGLYDAFMANPLLNGVILALLAVGIGYTFRSVVTLSPEIRWLQGLQAELAGQRVSSTPLGNPRLLGTLARMMADQQGRPMLSALSLRSLLDGIGARLAESREVSRYLIGLLVFMGLLGTFWGLLRTIVAVGDVIGSLSVEQGDLALIFTDLKEGLEAPLSGMGTAFSSSLFGLGGSLMLGFLELQATQAQNRFFNELEDWLSGAVRLTGGEAGPIGEGSSEPAVPAYLLSMMEQTGENIRELHTAMSTAEDSRRQTAGALIGLNERLTTLNEHMRTQQSVMVRLAEAQSELRPVLERLSSTAESDGFGIDEGTRQAIRSTEAHLRHLIDDLPVQRGQTVAEVRSEIKLLARTIAALAEEPQG